jgi:hypothetical protein
MSCTSVWHERNHFDNFPMGEPQPLHQTQQCDVLVLRVAVV